jgi:site-specific DNA-methyltransferase (adenine-specific)
VVLDEEAARLLDAQTGDLGVSLGGGTPSRAPWWHARIRNDRPNRTNECGYGDTGGASRFYYVAKPSREERDYGCEGLESVAPEGVHPGLVNTTAKSGIQQRLAHRNHHPTVKPVELMRWLVKLVTPIGGVVLDPFTGSGTTGMACRYERRGFVGIEQDAAYCAIAARRIAAVAPLFGDVLATPTHVRPQQGDLFDGL